MIASTQYSHGSVLALFVLEACSLYFSLVQKFRILPVDFSISGGELTPTMKLKRRVVLEKYTDLVEDMYREAVD